VTRLRVVRLGVARRRAAATTTPGAIARAFAVSTSRRAPSRVERRRLLTRIYARFFYARSLRT